MQHHTMWQTFIRGGRIIWLAVGALLLLLILRGGANEADQALLTALVKIYAIGSGLLVLLAYLGQSQRMTAGAHSLVKAAVLVWVGAGVLLMGSGSTGTLSKLADFGDVCALFIGRGVCYFLLGTDVKSED